MSAVPPVEPVPASDGEKVDILVVDDLPEKLLVFRTVLEELGQNLIFVRSGAEALREVLKREFAVILLDVNMPDIDGFETAELIRQYKRSAHTPIIFITSYADEMQTIRGYSLGAVDYILSPVVPEVLRSRILQTTLVPEVEIAPLPPLWSGLYREQDTYLEPEQPGDPYLTVLTAHDVRGTWDLLTWQALLMSDIELTLSVDVFTQPKRSERQLEDAARSLDAARKAVRYDQRTDRARSSVERALAVADTQHIHELHYAILLQERTLQRLEAKAAKVSELLGRRLRFERVQGAQRAYAQLFTDTPPWRITAPLVRRNTTSEGVGAKTPWGTCPRRRSQERRGQ